MYSLALVSRGGSQAGISTNPLCSTPPKGSIELWGRSPKPHQMGRFQDALRLERINVGLADGSENLVVDEALREFASRKATWSAPNILMVSPINSFVLTVVLPFIETGPQF